MTPINRSAATITGSTKLKLDRLALVAFVTVTETTRGTSRRYDRFPVELQRIDAGVHQRMRKLCWISESARSSRFCGTYRS